jgi:hypothetical protein
MGRLRNLAGMTDTTARAHKPAFDCPHCAAYSSMAWAQIQGPGGYMPFFAAKCLHCGDYSIWLTIGAGPGTSYRIVYPAVRIAVPPHPEMPTAPLELYQEAQDVATRSPRAAAALLRVAVDVLLREVVPGAGRKSLNDVIGMAVANGLTPAVQQALDVLRVVGNDAVHPESIVLDEQDPEAKVVSLSKLMNLVVEQLVATPRLAGEMLETLPETAREAIARRDSASD